MKKQIGIGIIILVIIIGIVATLGIVDFSSVQTEPSNDVSIIDESPILEDNVTEGKSIQINLSDGIGVGDR